MVSTLKSFWNSKFQISLAILVIQIIAIFDLLILMELTTPEIGVLENGTMSVIDGVFGLFLTILNARFMSFFFHGMKWYAFLLLIILSTILGGYLSTIPMSQDFSTGQLIFIISSVILGYFPPLIAMVYILMDSLKTDDDKVYKLIGAANLFILFPILFSGILFSLELIHPMIEGLQFQSLMDCIYFYTKLSFYGATGMEPPIKESSALLKNGLSIESFFMDLFTLLMLGRLVEK